MKKYLSLVLTCMLTAGSSSFNVEGMSCAHSCANKIKSHLDMIDGVNSYNVDFKNSTVTVDFDDVKLNDQKIVTSLVKNTGFKFSLSENKDFESKTSECKDSKECCSNKQKKGFFKRMFGWI